MRALLQRVSRAAVRVDGEEIARIGPGLLIFLGVAGADPPDAEIWLADRCAGLRIFADEAGRMNRSVREVNGEALVVSQFTLCADVTRGRRPGFESAAAPEHAEGVYERFCDALARSGVPAQRGWFGAKMEVELTNDGPVTFLLETPAERPGTPKDGPGSPAGR